MADNKPKGRDFPLSPTPNPSEKQMMQDRVLMSNRLSKLGAVRNPSFEKFAENVKNKNK